jgi:hypothetical protein
VGDVPGIPRRGLLQRQRDHPQPGPRRALKDDLSHAGAFGTTNACSGSCPYITNAFSSITSAQASTRLSRWFLPINNHKSIEIKLL